LSDTLKTVSKLIEEVVGDNLLEPITLETSFGDDLELESIELVTLAEKIQAEYGEQVNFADWLSQKELDELIHLKVGELVEFIDECLSSKPQG
jgi:acyl carrier protein